MYSLEVTSGASYEANKEAAKNSNLSAGNRIGYGVDAAKDKGMWIFIWNTKQYLNLI